MQSNRTISFALMVLSMWCCLLAADDADTYRIRLGTVDIIPRAGSSLLSSGNSDYVVVQFNNIPNAERQRDLSASGVKLLRYVGGNAYIAHVVSPGIAMSSEQPPIIRAAVPYSASMRLSPRLEHSSRWKNTVDADNNTALAVFITFHQDVPIERAVAALSKSGIDVARTSFYDEHSVQLNVSLRQLEILQHVNEVEMLAPPLTRIESDTLWARARSFADRVIESSDFFNVDGKGVRVGIWEAGGVPNRHVLFSDRLRILTRKSFVSEHATLVTGIIAAGEEGYGMAPGARVYGYDINNPRENAFEGLRNAAKRIGISLTNNSWSFRAGWSGIVWFGQELFGFYHPAVRIVDEVARKSDVLMFFSAGNQRGAGALRKHLHFDPTTGGVPDILFDDTHPSNPSFGSITLYNLTKNSVTVGATMRDDQIGWFSSRGPVDNGRIKPDLVADGWRVTSTIGNNDFSSFSGTSASTPVVTGIAATLSELYSKFFGSRVHSDTLKAILIHGARDLGRPGPDYTYGHGMIDAQLSAQTIRASANSSQQAQNSSVSDDLIQASIVEEKIDNDETQSFAFNVISSSQELRVTLVWHDPPGAGLINDLDLEAVSPSGQKYYPFSLDPNKPGKIATALTPNRIDNVENLKVDFPELGSWTIHVRGTSVPMGLQRYSLVYSASDGNNRDLPAEESTGIIREFDIDFFFTDETGNFLRKDDMLYIGDKFYIKINLELNNMANATIISNGTEDTNLYEVVTFRWQVKKGKKILTSGETDVDTIGSGKTRDLYIGSFDLHRSLTPGTYRAIVSVQLRNGASQKRVVDIPVLPPLYPK